jgi:hypothetical protein
MEIQVSVTTQSAPSMASLGSSVRKMSAPSRLAQSRTLFSGFNCGGQASASLNLSRAAAWIQEAATLLPSPVQAIRRPSIGPFASSNVMMSATIWQGWVRSVRPLITGTVAWSANSIKV